MATIFTKIGLIVPSEDSLHYWKKRLTSYGVEHGGITTFANRPAILFEDSEGLRLALIAAPNTKIAHWETFEKSLCPLYC